jgi:hypothetical protein
MIALARQGTAQRGVVMKLSIEVRDKQERDAIRRAIEDSEVRAIVVVIGTLLPFSDRARQRMITYVANAIAYNGECESAARTRD